MKKISISLALYMMFSFCYADPILGVSPIEEVIAAMSNEEKAHLLIGTGMDGYESNETTVVGSTKNIVPGCAGTTYPIPRLGIPAIVLADGPAGLRIDARRENDTHTYYCTHFPIETLLSASWNPECVTEVGRAMGNEVLEYGVDVLLAPALNIHRNPLNGRNFEYFSEDPLLSGVMAAAYVNGVQKNGVGTSIKHFAANNQETNRNNNNARISDRALREIYLRGFEKALDTSDPWTVMSSYNKINGIYTSEDYELLTEILRNEWGYPGLVMTDWFGGKDAVQQIRVGNDMLQPGFKQQYVDLLEAMNSGALSQEDVDRDIRRILELILKTPRFRGYRYNNSPDLKAHAEVARKAGVEGMVLLKNENKTLPLNPNNKKVALFGCSSYEMIPGGSGSGNVNRPYTVSLNQGMENQGFIVEKTLSNKYAEHLAAEAERLRPDTIEWWTLFFDYRLPEEIVFDNQTLKNLASENDFAVITIGRKSGEGADRNSADFNLKENERNLLENVAQAFHSVNKPVIVVLNIGGVIETDSWKNIPDAILLAWQPGQEGGNSVADVLSGVSYPSGKLPMSFPMNLGDHYSTLNFPVDMNPDLNRQPGYEETAGTNLNYDITNYEEDIYIGYRYFDSFDKEVSYPFGYGLNYTDFELGQPTVSYADQIYTLKIPVKNIGELSGKEVVQIYFADPDSENNNKPVKELKGFQKTKNLQPGETQEIIIQIPLSELASFDDVSSAWILPAGDYNFLIGNSSRDIIHNLTVKTENYHKGVENNMHAPKDLKTLKRI
ncbi:MAG: glycoside hydrolase family 3 C-terminal domain-containing protein [Muribaculaceae bacterium]|nr:glycoside hydrolase family 3 C-terminal domain-containing protein [Muribaculaceae bacterium]